MTEPLNGVAAADAYRFESPVPRDHYLARFIAYANRCTDAAHEYHEAAGLVLLASATANVRARLAPYPDGLPTNLYVLFVGDSTTSRKSTSKDLAQAIQQRALPGSLNPDQFSPEAFVEHLASRSNNSTTLYIDEFGELLDKLHHAKHMAGLRGLLMTIYSGRDYDYRRHSKRGRDGNKVEDVDRIERPHLSLLGATTGAIFEILRERDATTGLLPRIAIIMPSRKPPRKPIAEIEDHAETDRSELITWLRRLHAWSVGEERRVVFAKGVLEQLDALGAKIEEEAPSLSETGRVMIQRITPMAFKIAMLVAAGHPDAIERHTLEVALADATVAVAIAERWKADALAFAARIGENDFERYLQRCLRLVERKGSVPRSIVARQAHIEKRMLDSIRDTLRDRGLISLGLQKSASGPDTEIWSTPNGSDGRPGGPSSSAHIPRGQRDSNFGRDPETGFVG